MSTITRASTTPGVEQLNAFVADYIFSGRDRGCAQAPWPISTSKVTQKIESLYAATRPTSTPVTLPAEAAGPAMRAVHAEASKRLLGNGYCARPIELDCRYETICESCTMFFTTFGH